MSETKTTENEASTVVSTEKSNSTSGPPPLTNEGWASVVAEKSAESQKSDSTTEKPEVVAEAIAETDEEEPEKVASSEEEQVEQEEEVEKKGGKGFEKRLKRYAAQNSSLKELNDALLARLESLEERVGSKKAEKGEPATNDFKFDKPRPKLDDFNSVSDHAEAVADWKFDQRTAKAKYEAQQNEFVETREKAVKSFLQSGTKLETELGLEPGEWQETIGDATRLNVPKGSATAVALEDSPLGAKIAYEIATDDQLSERFNKMNQIQQVSLIGRLEAKFEGTNATVTEQKVGNGKMTKAKPPGPSIKGSGNSHSVQVNGKMSFAEVASKVKVKDQTEFNQIMEKIKPVPKIQGR